MDSTPPIIIKRSIVGYLVRTFFTAVAIALLFGWLWLLQQYGGGVPPQAMPIVILYLAAVAVIFLASIYL